MISCPVTTLAPTASTTCTAAYVTTQTDLDAGAIVNVATVDALDPTDVAVSDTDGRDGVGSADTVDLAPEVVRRPDRRLGR